MGPRPAVKHRLEQAACATSTAPTPGVSSDLIKTVVIGAIGLGFSEETLIFDFTSIRETELKNNNNKSSHKGNRHRKAQMLLGVLFCLFRWHWVATVKTMDG